MTYKITTTTPDISSEQLRLDAARHVYEALIRYINKTNSSTH